MTTAWYIKRQDEWEGPHPSSALKEMASSGKLHTHDVIRKGDDGSPTAAGSLKGLFSASTGPAFPSSMPPLPASLEIPRNSISNDSSVGVEPPPLPVSPALNNTQHGPELWNPATATWLSLPLNWGFGAFLLARNWRTLGEPQKEDRCMLWFYGFILYFIAGSFSDPSPIILVLPLFGGLAAFYYLETRPQQLYLQEKYGNQYQKKSWTNVFLVLFALFGAGTLVVIVFAAIGDAG